eukprot:TRINITY_DN11746_c0_g1_i6.p3 TRINITY_DN11746_c0_g1~~TRINITY_DN11746_c0_g1_i6.p3  ORF type:complete len:204 (+),score=2.33 TRINITY_DN11746_c0_g1_i6:278-889(+)
MHVPQLYGNCKMRIGILMDFFEVCAGTKQFLQGFVELFLVHFKLEEFVNSFLVKLLVQLFLATVKQETKNIQVLKIWFVVYFILERQPCQHQTGKKFEGQIIIILRIIVIIFLGSLIAQFAVLDENIGYYIYINFVQFCQSYVAKKKLSQKNYLKEIQLCIYNLLYLSRFHRSASIILSNNCIQNNYGYFVKMIVFWSTVSLL